MPLAIGHGGRSDIVNHLSVQTDSNTLVCTDFFANLKPFTKMHWQLAAKEATFEYQQHHLLKNFSILYSHVDIQNVMQSLCEFNETQYKTNW